MRDDSVLIVAVVTGTGRLMHLLVSILSVREFAVFPDTCLKTSVLLQKPAPNSSASRLNRKESNLPLTPRIPADANGCRRCPQLCFTVTLLMAFVFSGGREPAQRGAKAGVGAEAGKD